MDRRTFNKLLAGTTLSAGLYSQAVAQGAGTLKLGAIAPKTGPLAAGADITQWPNIYLWVNQVNEAGGLDVGGQKMAIELIEYDDQTNPGEHIRLAQRLAEQDQVDHIVAPYGTGFNLAAAPIYARYDYPMIAVSAISDNLEELTSRFGNLFFTLGTTTSFVGGVAEVLTGMREAGTIGNRVAMVNVADAFGIQLAEVARTLLPDAGFEIVYDQSYPLGTPDLAPVMQGVVNEAPDAFVAWSYPSDTFGLAEQAILQNLDVRAYYSAVATCFPSFGAAFGDKINNVLGAGGTNPSDPAIAAYREAHLAFNELEADYWASANTYAALEILGQAITGAGTIDRAAVTQHIKDNSFDTIMGNLTFENQVSHRYWNVGQWQDGVFRGVHGTNIEGAVPVRAKENWGA